jgi:hypothetical protein
LHLTIAGSPQMRQFIRYYCAARSAPMLGEQVARCFYTWFDHSYT